MFYHYDKFSYILFEDDSLLALNKPSGTAVHGGSGLSFGIIELVRNVRSEHKFFELVHRIDRDTSGVLLIAKKRSALVAIHKQMREKKIHKKYQVTSFKKMKSSLKFCVIAASEFDLYVAEPRACEWDIAAGHAILIHAGGQLTDFEGNEILYGKLNFKNPSIILKNKSIV